MLILTQIPNYSIQLITPLNKSFQQIRLSDLNEFSTLLLHVMHRLWQYGHIFLMGNPNQTLFKWPASPHHNPRFSVIKLNTDMGRTAHKGYCTSTMGLLNQQHENLIIMHRNESSIGIIYWWKKLKMMNYNKSNLFSVRQWTINIHVIHYIKIQVWMASLCSRTCTMYCVYINNWIDLVKHSHKKREKKWKGRWKKCCLNCKHKWKLEKFARWPELYVEICWIVDITRRQEEKMSGWLRHSTNATKVDKNNQMHAGGEFSLMKKCGWGLRENRISVTTEIDCKKKKLNKNNVEGIFSII